MTIFVTDDPDRKHRTECTARRAERITTRPSEIEPSPTMIADKHLSAKRGWRGVGNGHLTLTEPAKNMISHHFVIQWTNRKYVTYIRRAFLNIAC